MNRTAFVLGLTTAGALSWGHSRDAAACGGCFQVPTPPTQVASDVTDERMLLSVSPTQTTLYDQIVYTGAPSSFAWVLPIHGTVTVGLSADVLFDSIDALTATQIKPPPSSCPTPPACNSGGCFGGASTASGAFSSSDDHGPGSVTVTTQGNVGPYATVQLHATDSSALDGWLGQNGFVVPDDEAPVIAQYVSEGFDFLAMKLLPNEGVQAMRPVRVTTTGASFSLPLRMAAIGTGATVGITIWILSDGRYEPQNFPFFHIDDSSLIWDWSTSLSNYTTLRTQGEAALSGKGWEIESSIALSQQVISNVILSGGQAFNNGSGGLTSSASDPGQDYLPIYSDASDAGDAGDDEGGEAGKNQASVLESAEEVRNEDVKALFAGITPPNVRITRIRGDIAHAAMNVDLILQASADQSEVPNVRLVTRSVNETCAIYNGCNYVGTGTPAQANASEHGGCAATTRARADRSWTWGALAGSLALVAARVLRGRRSRPRKS